MTAHIVVRSLGDTPATMSREILHDLLRGELGFDGLVVTGRPRDEGDQRDRRRRGGRRARDRRRRRRALPRPRPLRRVRRRACAMRSSRPSDRRGFPRSVWSRRPRASAAVAAWAAGAPSGVVDRDAGRRARRRAPDRGSTPLERPARRRARSRAGHGCRAPLPDSGRVVRRGRARRRGRVLRRAHRRRSTSRSTAGSSSSSPATRTAIAWEREAIERLTAARARRDRRRDRPSALAPARRRDVRRDLRRGPRERRSGRRGAILRAATRGGAVW